MSLRNLATMADPLDLSTNGISHLVRLGLAAQVSGSSFWISGHILNCLHELVSHLIQLALAEPANHLSGRPESAYWVADALACDVWSGAMDGFEHGWICAGWVQVGRRGDAY